MSPSLCLKIAWFILAFLAIPASWLALIPFARAANVYWAPAVYGLAVTLLEATFCLGMIWKMNPTSMPESFCWAQAFLFALGTHVATGICACMAWAAYNKAFHPSYRSHLPLLAWRPAYVLLVVAYPIIASAAYLGLIVTLNAIQPTQELYCDASTPSWPRVLSYGGLPLIVAVPSSVLSLLAASRITRNEQTAARFHLHSDPTATRPDGFTPIPLTSKARRSFLSPRFYAPSWRISPHVGTPPEKDQRALSADVPSGIMTRSHLSHSGSPAPPKLLAGDVPFEPWTTQQPPTTLSNGSPAPSFRSGVSRMDTPSPMTFAPVPLPNPNAPNLASPLAPASQHYLPSFDLGDLYQTPQVISPDSSPTSPSRVRVSFDKAEVLRGFHLPRRTSIDTSVENEEAPPRPSLELSPEYALSKLSESGLQASFPSGSAGVSVTPSSANIHSLRWLPHQEELKEEIGEEEEEIETSQESVPYTHGMLRRGENATRFNAKGMLDAPAAVVGPPVSPISPSAAARSRSSLMPGSERTSVLGLVIIFSISFTFFIILAGISTWIDIARGRGPSTFGTQYFALILVGWSPLLVFGKALLCRHLFAISSCSSGDNRQRFL